MSQTCPTVKVKPWGANQGAFVEINAEDFDPAIFDSYDPEAEAKAAEELQAAEAAAQAEAEAKAAAKPAKAPKA